VFSAVRARIQIRAQLVTRNPRRFFDAQNTLSRDAALSGQPIGNRGLANAQEFREFDLAAGLFDGAEQCVLSHGRECTTESGFSSTTNCGSRIRHTRYVAKTAQTSEFWQRLKSLPAFKKLGQKAVGAIAGVGQTAANRWKLGTAWPTLDNARKLAKRGGCCVEWLLSSEGPRLIPPTDPAADELWELWPRLDGNTKSELVGFAKGRATPPSEDGVTRSKSA
jgi:hypothetical protein